MKRHFKRATVLMAVEQALVSGGNFVTTVICARLLTTVEFGMFSAVWLGILFLSSVMMAVIVFPMMTSFPGMSSKASARYLSGNVGVYLFGSLILAGIGFVAVSIFFAMGKPDISAVAIAGVAAAFAIHLQELLRRILILEGDTKRLIVSALITYMGRIVVLLVVFDLLDVREVTTALWALTATATVGALTAFPKPARLSLLSTKYAWKRNGESAKWLLPAGLMQWTTVNSFLMASSLMSPLTVLAQLRAAQNIATLSNPFVQLLENTIPVEAARRLHWGGEGELKTFTLRAALLAAAPLLCLTPIVFAFGGKLLAVIYGDQYADISPVLGMMWLLQLMVVLTVPIRSALRSLGNTRAWFIAYFVSTLMSVPAAFFLSSKTATLISLGMFLSNCVIIVTATFFLCRSGKALQQEMAGV